MKTKFFFLIMAGIGAVLLLGAFVNQSPASLDQRLGITLTPSEIPQATATPVDPPTATAVVPTATAVPTETPVDPPTATSTAAPSATPTSLPPGITATAAVPTPTATPNRSPSTGDPQPQLPAAGAEIFDWHEFWLPYSVELPANPGATSGRDLLTRLPRVDDSPILSLRLPTLGIDAPVVPVALTAGVWRVEDVQQAAAWLAETSLPGLGSNTVLTAHVSTLTGDVPLFRTLYDLKPGHMVRVETQAAVYYYQVREQRVVRPSNLSVLAATETPQLTLLTCTRWDAEKQLYTLRRVVIADLVDVVVKPAAYPAGWVVRN